jgi:hypothetical protein
MVGLRIGALLAFALAGAVLYYMRKFADALHRGEIYAPRHAVTAGCVLRLYDLIGVAAVIGVLAVLWRSRSLWAGIEFVLVAFFLSLVIQLALGVLAMRIGPEKITLAGLAIVPLAIAYTFLSLTR